MSENYREPEDLLSDPDFLSWYFNTSGVDQRTWEIWTQGRPDRDLLVKKAVALLDATRLPEKEPSPQQTQKAEQALMDRLNALDTDPIPAPIAILPVPSTAEELSGKRPAVIGRRRWM